MKRLLSLFTRITVLLAFSLLPLAISLLINFAFTEKDSCHNINILRGGIDYEN